MGCKQSIPKMTAKECKMSNRTLLYVKNKIYDVTDFIDEHPGGRMCIMKNRNKDCEVDYRFHSKNAQKKWDSMLIGYKENEIN